MPASVYPLLCFAYRGILKNKRFTIEGILSGKTQLYARAFGSESEDSKDISQRLFNFYYQPRAYVVPVLILVAVAASASATVLIYAGISLGLPADLEALLAKTPGAFIAGVAGAYTFGVYDVLLRYRSIDLTPISLHFVWLRLLIAPILATFVSAALKEPVSYLVALGIGAFPVKVLSDLTKREANKRLQLQAGATEGEKPRLHKLQGMSSDVINRLGEEGITSVQHVAQADPVSLLLRTSFEWKTILDFIDQAILFLYLGDKVEQLRGIGIRGAIELAEIGEKLNHPDTRVQAKKMLELVAEKIEQPTEAVRHLITTLSEDVQVDFISTLWGETVWAGKDLVDVDEIRSVAERVSARRFRDLVLSDRPVSVLTEGEEAAIDEEEDSEESVPGEAAGAALEAYIKKRESGSDG